MEQGEIQESKDSGKTPADLPVVPVVRLIKECILCKGAGVLKELDKDGNEVSKRCVLCLLIQRFLEAHGGQIKDSLEASLRFEANLAIMKEIQRQELMEE